VKRFFKTQNIDLTNLVKFVFTKKDQSRCKTSP